MPPDQAPSSPSAARSSKGTPNRRRWRYALDRVSMPAVARRNAQPDTHQPWRHAAGLSACRERCSAAPRPRRCRTWATTLRRMASRSRCRSSCWSDGHERRLPARSIFGLYTQVTMRQGWTAPAGGLEFGYSWIEGYNVALRAGARRPETDERAAVVARRRVHGGSAHGRIRASSSSTAAAPPME